MKKNILRVCLLMLLPLVSQAVDINAGQDKTASCMACHGEKGISVNPMWPNLAGQQTQYLVKQLKDFKSGKRKDGTMNAMVMALSVEDIENISAYYNSLK